MTSEQLVGAVVVMGLWQGREEDVTVFDWIILGGAAFAAGLVDSIVGGGGLIQLPVLLGQFPQISVPSIFGTNKIASIVGTSSAMMKFARNIQIPWRAIVPAAGAALIGAWIGATLAALLPREWMRPLVLVFMVGAAFYTFAHKDFGSGQGRVLVAQDTGRMMLLGLLGGVYDGFFGPGTGSLLIFALVRFFGMDFLRVSASAKVINVATNFSALTFFAAYAPLMWGIGLVMAVCNLIGSLVGIRLAIQGGAAFVRQAFLLVVVVLIAKLAWDMVQAW